MPENGGLRAAQPNPSSGGVLGKGGAAPLQKPGIHEEIYGNHCQSERLPVAFKWFWSSCPSAHHGEVELRVSSIFNLSPENSSWIVLRALPNNQQG